MGASRVAYAITASPLCANLTLRKQSTPACDTLYFWVKPGSVQESPRSVQAKREKARIGRPITGRSKSGYTMQGFQAKPGPNGNGPGNREASQASGAGGAFL